jgi:hypothetical protein
MAYIKRTLQSIYTQDFLLNYISLRLLELIIFKFYYQACVNEKVKFKF